MILLNKIILNDNQNEVDLNFLPKIINELKNKNLILIIIKLISKDKLFLLWNIYTFSENWINKLKINKKIKAVN